ncbi:MAG: ATP-binding protein [Planctomycetes bacterium]|nr:ATP-binding protein [Planctomycetota bacterium]
MREISRQRPALVLTGCRQAGKTSLLQQVFPGHGYISLDLPSIAEEAEEAGGQFLRKHLPPLIIDEIQHAPKLLRYLKRTIDENRDKTGLYCLTGSQKFPLMEGISESLAGRVAVIECQSLSAKELECWRQSSIEGELLLDLIFKGGYPELHAKGLEPERFFSDYLATYLERDVRQVIQVRSLRDFDRFMRLAAIRSGHLLSANSFASDLGLSPNTVKSWLSVLQASNIIYLLEPYYRNLGKRLVKTPKLYFLDTGLACFLAGIRSQGDLERSALLGALFETHVLGQMVRWHSNRGRRPLLCFYRDHEGHEIDFVIPIGEKLKLFECKWSESPPDVPKGFEEITALVGEKNILSRSVITPTRGYRGLTSRDLILDDSIELKSLEI